MSATKSSLRAFGIAAIVLLALAAGGLFVFLRQGEDKPSAEKQAERVTQKEARGVRFKRPQDAKFRGIEVQQVTRTPWQPYLQVDGRVIPNPQATLEIRAPFAGILRIEASESRLHLGAAVAPFAPLAMFDARFTPTEKLDLEAKLAEADARRLAAEKLLKIRQESLDRRANLPAGLLSQDDIDTATGLLAEAKMQAHLAQTHWDIWKQALQAAGKETVKVSIQSPMAGEIVEIGVQPGTPVDAGQLIARIVDFQRVLLRLDFPATSTRESPPPSVQVRALDADTDWRASLRGRAPALETGLQKASWFYEIMPDKEGISPRWQAGLFVRALVKDSNQPPVSVIAIPSSSLLVHQGRTLVYIEKRPGRYERREVDTLGRMGNQLYVADEGWLVEDRVVTRGAQVLLSEEFRNEMDED